MIGKFLPRAGAVLLLPTLLAVACASEKKAEPANSAAAKPDASTVTTTTKGTYVAAKSAAEASSNAYIYDPQLVPSGATAEVTIAAGEGKTKVKLAVSGYVPNKAYGAHLHAKVCGVAAADSGPHYQYKPDPAASTAASVDPAYANASNEVWLDFTTDASGKATANTEVSWVAKADRRPAALVIHAEQTKTEAGKAGSAGARASCMTLNK
jgi:Cu-Zn family superoxide dismutase